MELLWVLDNLPDVRSDLSVFHGVRELDQLSSRQFCEYANRLVHYRGVIRDKAETRAMEEMERSGRKGPVREVELEETLGRDEAKLRQRVEVHDAPYWERGEAPPVRDLRTGTLVET